ncbi:MAG: hypothetical protein ACI9EW_002562 [Cellvibrionaceae bacterium]
MFNPFGSKDRQLPDGYIEITVNPSRIWKSSVNMIYWPTIVRIRNYLELHHFSVTQKNDMLIVEFKTEAETDPIQFEIHVEPQLSVGRGSRKVAVVMGPIDPAMPPEIHGLKDEIAGLFVKGTKINWKGPENLKGWWDE